MVLSVRAGDLQRVGEAHVSARYAEQRPSLYAIEPDRRQQLGGSRRRYGPLTAHRNGATGRQHEDFSFHGRAPYHVQPTLGFARRATGTHR